MSRSAELHEQRRLERAVGRARFVGAAIALLIGPLFPNLGVPFVIALGLLLLAYGTFFRLRAERTSSGAEERRLGWLSLGADTSIVAYAMLVFSPDPLWTTFVLGVLIIIVGTFRFGRSGAVWSTFAMSLSYAVVALFRDRSFGLTFEPSRVAFHVAFYLLTALLVAGILSELQALRRDREDLVRRASELRAIEEAERREIVAEQAERARRALLMKASHELRTPLNAILGFSELLHEQIGATITERQSRYLRNIRDAGERLLQLVNGLLELSRIETRGVDLDLRSLTIDELLSPVIAATSRAAEEQGFVFQATMSPDVTVRLDAARIRQVLTELLSNAARSGSGGRVSLRAAVDGAAITFEVADAGPGIPADRSGRLFEILEPRPEHDEASGGFGLAVAKRLVELHAGTIEVESEVGRGTTFRVRLPEAVADGHRGYGAFVAGDGVARSRTS